MKKILALGTALAMTTLVLAPTAAANHIQWPPCNEDPIVDPEPDPGLPDWSSCDLQETIDEELHKDRSCDDGEVGATHEDLGEQCHEPPEECSRDDEIGVDGGTAGDFCYTEEELCEMRDDILHMPRPIVDPCAE